MAKALSRESISAAAIAVIRKTGPAGLTLERLCESLGAESKAIYNHICLQDLKRLVLFILADDMALTVSAEVKNPSGLSGLLQFGKGYWAYVSKNRNEYDAIVTYSKLNFKKDPCVDKVRKLMETILRTGCEPDENLEQKIECLHSFIHGFSTLNDRPALQKSRLKTDHLAGQLTLLYQSLAAAKAKL